MGSTQALFLSSVFVFFACTITGGIRGRRGDRWETALAVGAVVLSPLLLLASAAFWLVNLEVTP